MKLIIATFSFIIFIFRVSSLEFDLTDDRTIETFLAQFFQGGDPSLFKSIETEVKQHSHELLNGFLSLVGGSFDVESSDMDTQLNKFKEDFDVEKLKKIVEDIFGIGSVVVSQLQKNSDTVKDRITALIDIVLSDSGSARKKRSNEDRPENLWNSGCTPHAENSSKKKRCLNNPESQQGQSKEEKDHRRVGKIHPAKKNKKKTKEHPKKDADYITPGVKFHKRDNVGENDIQNLNDGSETLHLDSMSSDSLKIIQEERKQHDVLDYKLENGLFDGVPIQESDNGLQDDTVTQEPDMGMIDSVIPDNQNQKNDDEQEQMGNGSQDDTQTQKPDEELIDSLIPDRKHRKNDDGENSRHRSNHKGGLDNWLRDSVIPDDEDRKNDDEQNGNDDLQDDTQTENPDEELRDSLIPRRKHRKNHDKENSRHRSNHKGRSDNWFLDSVIPDRKDRKNDDEQNGNDDDQKWDNDSQNGTQTQRPDKGLLYSLIPGRKHRKNDDEEIPHHRSNHRDGSDNWLTDSAIPDDEDRMNDDDENPRHRSNRKGRRYNWLPDSLLDDSKNQDDDDDDNDDGNHDEKHRYARPNHRYRSRFLNIFRPFNRNQHKYDTVNENDDTREDYDYRKEYRYDRVNHNEDARRKEVRVRLRNLGVLSQDFVEELLDLSELNMDVMEKKALKALGAIRENVDISRDRALDFFNIYGNYLYDIFDRNEERIREIFRY